MIKFMSAMVLPILLSLGATIAAAVIVPLSNGIHQAGIFPNDTSAPRIATIDPRFTTTYEPGPVRLSTTSTLMNAVNAMMELALENFTEPILARNYESPGYPEVVIVPVRLTPGNRVEVRFLLWGIWEGIRWMISHRSFQDLMIDAYWDGILVCRIWIKRGSGGLSIAGNSSTLGLTAGSEKISIGNATVEATQGVSMIDIRNSLNDQHLTVSVIGVGEALGITEVFIAVFAALEYMAHFPSTDEVVGFQISPDHEDTIIGIVEHTLTPPVRPPFLEYQWVILSIGQIPEYMLQQRRFTEVIIEIAVDGVPLGEGFLSNEGFVKN